MAISAPIEAKDELAETGLEALGAQPVIDAPRPALEIGERGVDPGENFMGRLVADDRHLAFRVAPGPSGAPLSCCGWLTSSISTRPDSGLRSGVAMARRSLAASIQALRQDPTPSRFCNCRAEMPLEWVAIRWAARNQIASDSLVRCRR